MSKIILTKEQAEAIEDYKHEGFTLDYFSERRGEYIDVYKSLKRLTLDEMARALYDPEGYEVEEDIKAGDWVKVNWGLESPPIRKVTYVTDDYVWVDGDQGNKIPPKEIVEHATPEEIAEEKQRRWWRSHGRKVWELRGSDELVSIKSQERFDVLHVFDNGDIIVEDTNPNSYGQKRATTVKKSYIEQYYRVVCFAEDRRDLGNYEQKIVQEWQPRAPF